MPWMGFFCHHLRLLALLTLEKLFLVLTLNTLCDELLRAGSEPCRNFGRSWESTMLRYLSYGANLGSLDLSSDTRRGLGGPQMEE